MRRARRSPRSRGSDRRQNRIRSRPPSSSSRCRNAATAPAAPRFSRRAALKGGALIVGFALTGVQTRASAQGAVGAPRPLDAKEVDAYLAVNGDGTVTVYCGKVDLGQGLRIAIPQIAAEELGIGIERIRYIEGDTALTPNQGRTSGSTGIHHGGMQIRQAAATPPNAFIHLPTHPLNP